MAWRHVVRPSLARLRGRDGRDSEEKKQNHTELGHLYDLMITIFAVSDEHPW
jgi:hypothetical protein